MLTIWGRLGISLRLATAIALPVVAVVAWLGKICLQSQWLVRELCLQLWLLQLSNQHGHLLNLSLLAHQFLILLLSFFSPALLLRLVLVELFGPHLVRLTQAFDLWKASLLFNLPLPFLDILAWLEFDSGFLAWFFQWINLLQVNLLFTHKNSRCILHLLRQLKNGMLQLLALLLRLNQIIFSFQLQPSQLLQIRKHRLVVAQQFLALRICLTQHLRWLLLLVR